VRLSFVRNMGLLVLAVVGIASRADAGIITVPPGLAPGSQYRLAFVTADTYNAESSSISTYNDEVNAEADAVAALAALGTTWLDIGSTEAVNLNVAGLPSMVAVDAITNIGIDHWVPIYNLDGWLVAGDAGQGPGGLFSGTLQAPIAWDPTGAYTYAEVFTGTTATGTVAHYSALGDGGSAYGIADDDTSDWVYDWDASGSTGLRLYGISGVLTVPDGSVPEPATAGMALAGGALMFFARRRVHRNRRATRTLC